MYLVCGIRPNIALIVRQLNCHNLNLKAKDFCIAKQVL